MWGIKRPKVRQFAGVRRRQLSDADLVINDKVIRAARTDFVSGQTLTPVCHARDACSKSDLISREKRFHHS